MDMRAVIDHVLDARPLALGTDFDGALSPIVGRPELARVDPICRARLAQLAQEVRLVAVISGRPVDEVRELVYVPGVVYVGNHGLEKWEKGVRYVEPRAAEYAHLMKSLLEQARQELELPGVRFEDKGVTAAVHYRCARDTSAAFEEISEILRRLAAEHGLVVAAGRRVVELRPPIEVDKGTALRELLDRYRVRSAIYAGDDQTDVDAFRALRRWGIQRDRSTLAIGVKSTEAPPALAEADVLLDGVQGFAEFLASLVAALGRSP